jgi:hypothetical protein
MLFSRDDLDRVGTCFYLGRRGQSSQTATTTATTAQLPLHRTRDEPLSTTKRQPVHTHTKQTMNQTSPTYTLYSARRAEVPFSYGLYHHSPYFPTQRADFTPAIPTPKSSEIQHALFENMPPETGAHILRFYLILHEGLFVSSIGRDLKGFTFSRHKDHIMEPDRMLPLEWVIDALKRETNCLLNEGYPDEVRLEEARRIAPIIERHLLHAMKAPHAVHDEILVWLADEDSVQNSYIHTELVFGGNIA